MRRWELVADGSARFWEIGRDGTGVTVRYGRLGSAGQTKVKDLGSEALAVAQVDKLLGLTNKGWRRGEPQDGGMECWITRPLPGGGTVVVNLDPGIAVGVVTMFEEQRLTDIWHHVGGNEWHRTGARKFGDLDPITASEVLAGLTSLTS